MVLWATEVPESHADAATSIGSQLLVAAFAQALNTRHARSERTFLRPDAMPPICTPESDPAQLQRGELPGECLTTALDEAQGSNASATAARPMPNTYSTVWQRLPSPANSNPTGRLTTPPPPPSAKLTPRRRLSATILGIPTTSAVKYDFDHLLFHAAFALIALLCGNELLRYWG